MKNFNFINIFIFILSFSTLLLTSYLFVGDYAFTFEMVLFILGWLLFAYNYSFNEEKPTSMKVFKKIIKDKFKDKFDPININPELNHENLQIRQYYLNQIYFKNLFCVFFINLFFPIYVFAIINHKRNFGKYILAFFESNFLINYYFNKKKKIIIEKRKVIENNKEYDVFLYLDGKEEYRYKNKIHRENGAAILYDKKYFFITNSMDKSKFFIFGKEVNEFDLKKELKKHNIINF